jgi:hypothetical protein
MYSLEDIFKQAEKDYHSKILSGRGFVSFLCYGFKVVKDLESGEINIIDMTNAGDFYAEITSDVYYTFQRLGWKKAIYVLYMNNCRLKLSRLESRINNALVNNESVKHIRKLKASREQILRNFNKVKIKLN